MRCVVELFTYGVVSVLSISRGHYPLPSSICRDLIRREQYFVYCVQILSGHFFYKKYLHFLHMSQNCCTFAAAKVYIR